MTRACHLWKLKYEYLKNTLYVILSELFQHYKYAHIHIKI